jgi:hypothetical protein
VEWPIVRARTAGHCPVPLFLINVPLQLISRLWRTSAGRVKLIWWNQQLNDISPIGSNRSD